MRVLTVLLLAATALPAQVFLVDRSGGPTANFTSIATAVATVPDGSVLVINPGIYDGFSIQGKSLTLIGTSVLVSAVTPTPVRIGGLAANQTVSMFDIGIKNEVGIGAIECTNCAGTIVLAGCRGDSATSPFGGQVVAVNCDQVHLRDCFFSAQPTGTSALAVTNSNIAAIGAFLSADNAPAVVQIGGRIDALGSGFYSYVASPTVQMQGGELTFRRGGILAGNGASGRLVDGAGALRLDPANTLYNAAPQPFGAGVVVQTMAVPSLRAWTGPLGTQGVATLEGDGAATGILALGFTGAPYLPAGLADPLWLLPGTESIQAIGALPLSASYPVPSASWVLGITIAWQGLTLSPATGAMLSNPSVYTHH